MNAEADKLNALFRGKIEADGHIRQADADYFWRWARRNRPAWLGRFDPLLSQPS